MLKHTGYINMKTLLAFLLTALISIFLIPAATAQNFAGKKAEENKNEPPTSSLEATEEESLPPEVINFVTELNTDSLAKYTLGPMDVIDIAVLRHPEVSGPFQVNKEGKIQYQFVGDVIVANKTKEEAKAILVQHLSEYIISPEVTVKIIGYNSKVVYVIGEVGAPGKIYMQGDTITVREALVQSGLPLLSAATKKCPLITPTADGKPQKKDVNVFALLYEGDLRENLIMKPGDTLYIPATILSKAMRVIQPVSQPITTSASTGRTVMTGF